MLNQEFFIETKNFMMAKLNLFLVPKSAKIFAHNHLYKVTLYLLQLFGIYYSVLTADDYFWAYVSIVQMPTDSNKFFIFLSMIGDQNEGTDRY